MYSRNYANTSDGTVRAFENAYAKEEFLKKCASGKINEVSDDNANDCENQNNQIESIREGNVNLKDSYCRIYNGEIYALGVHVSPYEKGNVFNRDPMREKKLLMHKKEILKLFNLVSRDSYTLVPLSLYFSGSRLKVEVGLCRGKKLYDKRDTDAKNQAKREIERNTKYSD